MSKESQPNLSLLAAFDEMCRQNNALMSAMISDENEYMKLISKFEECRVNWLSTEKKLESISGKCNDMVKINKELLELNKTNEYTIRHLRTALAKEVKSKDEFRKQLDAIRKFVLEDPSIAAQNYSTRQSMLAHLNLNRLDTVTENSHSSDDSASKNDISFDTTDDEILDEQSKLSLVANIKDNNVDNGKNGKNVRSNDDKTENAMSPKRDRFSSIACALNDEQITTDPICDKDLFKSNQHRNEENVSSKFRMSENEMRRSGGSGARFGSLGFVASASESHLLKTVPLSSISNRLDNRKHRFVKKTVIKIGKCDACGKRIGFCSECYKCCDCFTTCHMECHDKVPLPCIPFNRQNVKNNETRLIADYVAINVRPAIPAQIVMICNEIEKRGLNEESLYKIAGSYDIVNQLYRDMFVKPKKLLPALESFEVKVLCSVLKKFLVSLKEPLVTRILWRDFIQAAEQTNIDDEQRLIKQSISELPTANRDTLAFLMLHLQRITKSVSTKMDEKNIATVLGPTIIGHSSPNLPYCQIMAEFRPQTNVIQSLLRMPEDYWNSVASVKQTPQTSSNADHRQSLGTRLFGGTNVTSGILTPHQTRRANGSLPKGSRVLKPLF